MLEVSPLPASSIGSPFRLLAGDEHGHTMSAADRKTMMTFQGSPAPPLEDDNILSMILFRLPTLPSSLPRVSVVCKRWRRLVTHPHFRRSFLAHHKKAPLLGFFCVDYHGYKGEFGLRTAVDPPNRMLVAHFSCLLSQDNLILGCHHGRLLSMHFSRNPYYLVVWDPITGDRRHIEIPQMFGNKVFHWKGMVVCASREKDHIHGACHSQPFQVVIIGCKRDGVLGGVYSSETCTWGNLISLLQPQLIDMVPDITVSADCQGSLVGNSVYWVPVGLRGDVLEFDLHRQTLAIIGKPPDASNFISSVLFTDHQYFILPVDGGGLSFIVLTRLSVHVWKRISNGHDVGVAGWLFDTTVDLSNLLSLKPRVDRTVNQGTLFIVGHDEDGNMIFKLSGSGTVFLVHLKTLQFKELPEKVGNSIALPFSSFYTAGNK